MNGKRLVEGKKTTKDLKKKYRIPKLAEVVRQKCLQCCVGSSGEVRKCHINDCANWAYRFGRSPKPEDLKVPVYDNDGELIGYDKWEGYVEEY